MVDKYKFNNNTFLQKFLLNNSKPDLDSKIEGNINGYTIENTGNKYIYY